MPSQSRESTFRWRGVRFEIIGAAAVDVDAWLPADRVGDPSAAPDVRYVVDPWRPAWGTQGDRYRIARNGVVRYLGSDRERLARWLRADMDEQAGRATTIAIAGDAVAWRGRAILLPRPGRIGTSTLIAELVRGGAAHHAERIAVLDPAGRVHAAGTGVAAAAPELALVVATTYQPGLTWQPRSISGARALLPLVESARLDDRRAASLLRDVARLGGDVVSLQGPRGEAAAAAAGILAALDEIIDGGPAPAREPHWLARARALASGREPGATGAPGSA